MSRKSLSSIRYKTNISTHTLENNSNYIGDLFFMSTFVITNRYPMENYVTKSGPSSIRSYKYTRRKMYDFAIDYVRRLNKRLSRFKDS